VTREWFSAFENNEKLNSEVCQGTGTVGMYWKMMKLFLKVTNYLAVVFALILQKETTSSICTYAHTHSHSHTHRGTNTNTNANKHAVAHAYCGQNTHTRVGGLLRVSILQYRFATATLVVASF
jgi:hypothetical protein